MINENTNKFTAFLKVSVVLTLLNGSTWLMAHEDASDPTFCTTGDMIEIGIVEMAGKAMVKMLKGKPVDCPIGVKKLKLENTTDKKLKKYVSEVLINRNPVMLERHDFFDNTPARLAYAYASCICSSLANQDYSPNEIRPLIISPEILLHENHHVEYDLNQGIRFSCQICKTRK